MAQDVHQARSSFTKPPADGLRGLKAHWPVDVMSGFIIFLIALPLSVGIAIASGAPPTAGLLGAIVGGILGSLFSGSYLTINGPAAGLIVIVVGAIQELGHGDPQTGFRRALAAFAVAGVLQIVFAALRLGALGVSVPGSVIHGMMTAIGVIIIAKQVPVALGVPAPSKEVLGLIAGIPKAVAGMNPEVALIAAVGFLILMAFRLFKGGWTKYVPAPLVVVVAGMGLAKLFDFDHVHLVSSHLLNFEVGPKLLLNLPENLANAVVFPDWSEVFTATSIRWSIALALVASIESLLSAAAVDGMDPYRRVSNLDRELLTKGFCNLLCGLIGGLPIIAEIVRSSANVRNGAQTRWANFFHGTFILTFLMLFSRVLHEIPLSALAALLIAVGCTLAHPSQVVTMARIGRDHLLAFLTTLAVTVASDLLVGVAAGIAVELVFNLLHGASPASLFRVTVNEKKDGGKTTLAFVGPLVFTNLLSLRKRIRAATAEPYVFLDLSKTTVVDHTVLEYLHRLEHEAELAGRRLEFSFSHEHRPISAHPLAARRRVRAAWDRHELVS